MKTACRRQARSLSWLVLAVLLLQLPARSEAFSEVKPEVVEYPAENYESGPGWPDGWTPPPPPEGMSEQMRAKVQQVLREHSDLYDRYDWWVWDPLPAWTQEYPWFWREDMMGCGTTLHVYAYPVPDTQLITRVLGRSFGWTRLYLEPCRYEPIQFIAEARELTEEEKLAEGRGIEYEYWMDKSHPLVPIRFISEMMGADVEWDYARRRVTIHFPAVSREVIKAVPAPGYDYRDLIHPETHLPDPYRFLLEKQTVSLPVRTIVLTSDHPVAVVDGREVPLDAPPVIRNNRTMVPVRFLAEQMGAKVYWVGAEPIFRLDDGSISGTYQVHIFTPFFPLYEYPSWYLENRAVRY